MDLRSATSNRQPSPSNMFVRGCRSTVAVALVGAMAVAAALVCAPRPADAAPLTAYTWTGNGSGGVWQNGSQGQFNAPYVNSPAAQAIFTGTAETVTVAGSVQAASLSFLTGGYTLSGGTVSLAGAQITTAPGTTTIDSSLAGTGAWSVGGTGRLHLGGDSSSTLTAALTLADSATLDLGFSGKVGGNVVLGAGNALSGSGAVGGTVSGGGNVSPGSSPGILTAAAIAPAGGLSFTFEFDDFGPIYNFPTASQNDVLRLTSPTAPFASSLTSANVVNLFLIETTIIANNSYEGGFFTDLSTDFTSSIAAADFRYYVRGDGNGTDATLNGQGYYSFANWKVATGANPALNFIVSTIPRTTEFVLGTPVSGRSMLVTAAVPEPPTYAIALSALGLAAVFAARRRGRSAPRLRPAVVAAAGLLAFSTWLMSSAAAADPSTAAVRSTDGHAAAVTAPARLAATATTGNSMPVSGILALASARDFAPAGTAPAAAAGAWAIASGPLATGGALPAVLDHAAGAGTLNRNAVSAILVPPGKTPTFAFDESGHGYALPALREVDVVQLTHLATCFASHKRVDRRTVNAERLISSLLPPSSAGAKPPAPRPRDVSAL